MARKCKVQKDKRQRRLVDKFRKRRNDLRAKIKDHSLSFEEKLLAQQEIQKLPKDSNRCRLRNRCAITGRARGVYRKFRLARHKLRELAMLGIIPGLRKASW